jgi:DNA-binding transcriptional ArsR family regulator
VLYLLESLITSKTRIKLMLKFFLNPQSKAYLRGLAEELGESSNGVRIELNRLTEAGLLASEKNGRMIVYRANTGHSLFTDLHNLVIKYTGIDRLVDTIITHLGNVEYAFITGDYAQGIDSGLIDLVIVGDIDKNYLNFLVEKAETIIKRKIRTLVLTKGEFEEQRNKFFEIENALVVWSKGGKPHE